MGVAITAISPVVPASTAGFTAGSIPMIGTSNFSRSSFIAALVAVLQAMTTALSPFSII